MAGKYTDITSVAVPSSAAPGSKVTVTVTVYNKGGRLAISVTGAYDTTGFFFTPEYVWLNYGSTYTFTGSFTMPSTKVRVHLSSWIWDGAKWVADDYTYRDIALATVGEAQFKDIVGSFRVQFY